MADDLTPRWTELNLKAIERLLSDEPGYEFLVLKAHLLAERALDTLVELRLADPDPLRNRRLSFELKLALAQALGTVPPALVAPLVALNKLRNKVAHVDGFRITGADLNRLDYGWDQKIRDNLDREIATDMVEAVRTATTMLVFTLLEPIFNEEVKRGGT